MLGLPRRVTSLVAKLAIGVEAWIFPPSSTDSPEPSTLDMLPVAKTPGALPSAAEEHTARTPSPTKKPRSPHAESPPAVSCGGQMRVLDLIIGDSIG